MKYNKVLKTLKNYEAGKPIELVVREYGINAKDIIKLASNENPYGTSPKVVSRLQKIAKNASIYPDDSFFELKNALSLKYEVEQKNIIIGAGSDQILEFAVHAVLNKNETALMNNITFAMYEIYTKTTEAKIVKTKSIHHDLDEFYKLYKKHKPKLIFLCTPNNPTGDAIKKSDLISFLDKIDKKTFVIIDGAYMEYAKFKDADMFVNVKELMSKYTNILYTGTFSKAYGLGGMRVGFGIAQEDIILNLHKLRPPFNITTLSLSAAICALKDEKFIEKCIKNNFLQMQKYIDFAKKNSIKYIESYTNFITMILEKNSSKKVAKDLLQKGIIIRDLSSYGINAIRITIGKERQNKKVLKSLKEVLSR